MAIDSLDRIAAGLVGALGGGPQTVIVTKSSLTNATAGSMMSLWRTSGLPTQGGIPAAPALCNNLTAGGAAIANATEGRTIVLPRASFLSGNTATDVHIFDRLAHMGGLNGTLLTTQTVNLDISGSAENMAARRQSYASVQWWIEIYADLGTTAVNYTVNYTRGDGLAGQTTAQFEQIGSTTSSRNRIGRMIPIIPPNGDSIQSIQSITLAASTGAAGSFGVTATRLITNCSLGIANSHAIFDWAALGLPQLESGACVMLAMYPTGTTTGALFGNLKLIEG